MKQHLFYHFNSSGLFLLKKYTNTNKLYAIKLYTTYKLPIFLTAVLFSFQLFFITPIFAQQLCYLKEKDAKKAVEFLEKEQDILIYCDCNGSGDLGRRIKISKVYAKSTEREGYFSVFVEGEVIATFKLINQQLAQYTPDIAPLTEPEMLDLAFVHVRGTSHENEKNVTIYDTLSLGIYLGFVCDPCVEPFTYPSDN